MRSGDLVELAAHVGRHAPLLFRSGTILTASLDEYWLAAKCRFERWTRAIRRFQDAYADADAEERKNLWLALRPIVEEILLSDVLARVWGATVAAAESLQGDRHAELIVRSVLLDQMEARHRALSLLVDHRDLPRRAIAGLNQLRRRSERWTDYLLASLIASADVAEYAIDPARAREFAADLATGSEDASQEHANHEHAWKLALVSLRGAFQRELSSTTRNADLNTRIAVSIVGCFPPEALESVDALPSLWLARLAHACSDVESLVASALV